MPNIEAGLVGTWSLVSCSMEDVATGECTSSWGRHPNGCLVLSTNGRWIVLQTAEDRGPRQSESGHDAAYASMLSYAGWYVVDADTITIKVDIAWDEAWTGTVQVRYFRLEADILHIEAAPQVYAAFGGKLMRGHLSWKRDLQ